MGLIRYSELRYMNPICRMIPRIWYQRSFSFQERSKKLFTSIIINCSFKWNCLGPLKINISLSSFFENFSTRARAFFLFLFFIIKNWCLKPVPKSVVYLNTAIWRLYRVSGVLIEYSAHNYRYSDVRPSETLILVILGHFFMLRIKIHEMSYLQHLKWPIAVRRPFLLSLYGVSGVVIEYSAHNCR